MAEIGMLVQACAYGQAASTIFAQNAVGRDAAELADIRDALAHWLSDDGSMPAWPEIHVIAPDRLNAVRRAAVQLAFEAAAEAAATAAEKRAA